MAPLSFPLENAVVQALEEIGFQALRLSEGKAQHSRGVPGHSRSWGPPGFRLKRSWLRPSSHGDGARATRPATAEETQSSRASEGDLLELVFGGAGLDVREHRDLLTRDLSREVAGPG